MACQKVCKQCRDDMIVKVNLQKPIPTSSNTSVDARHLGASLSEQQTADLLLCHGTQQDLSLSTVSQMLASFPARAANMTTHAWTKLYTEIMS